MRRERKNRRKALYFFSKRAQRQPICVGRGTMKEVEEGACRRTFEMIGQPTTPIAWVLNIFGSVDPAHRSLRQAWCSSPPWSDDRLVSLPTRGIGPVLMQCAERAIEQPPLTDHMMIERRSLISTILGDIISATVCVPNSTVQTSPASRYGAPVHSTDYMAVTTTRSSRGDSPTIPICQSAILHPLTLFFTRFHSGSESVDRSTSNIAIRPFRGCSRGLKIGPNPIWDRIRSNSA